MNLSEISPRRFWFTICSLLVLFGLIVFQSVQLMILRRPTLEALAKRQHELKIDITPVRGQIFDRHGKELATSLKVPSVYAVPRLIGKNRKKDFSRQIADILKLDQEFVLERISRDKAFIWLKRYASFEEAKAIHDLEDPGLGLMDEFKRFYPQGELGAHMLGFVNIDNEGLEGIERMLNDRLQGRSGVRYTKRDAMGREIKAFEFKEIPAVDGHRVHLTMDRYLQYVMEESLDHAFQKWKAKGAAAILMEAKTGKIVAMANRPGFDPNYFGKSVADQRRNRAISDMFEPGSTFKIVTAAAALNEGKVTPQTKIDCGNGEYKYGSHVLHDVHPYGKLTFPEVIIKSSNIGTVKIAAMLQPSVLQQYIEEFGFGKPSGIDLPGEASGFVNPPSRWSKTSPYNIPMGHEIMVTLIQLVRAMAVVANGGDLVTPFIIDKIKDQAGVTLYQNQPKIKKGIIRAETALILREILARVVEEGTGKNARIDRVKVGGKTGTAQKVLPNGKGYSHSNFISSFVGFAPADNPQYVMAVMLDDPKPKYYGGTVAAPVFKEVMSAALIASGTVPPTAEFFTKPAEVKDFPDNPPILLPASA